MRLHTAVILFVAAGLCCVAAGPVPQDPQLPSEKAKCTRYFPRIGGTHVSRCRYLCRGWPIRAENEPDGVSCGVFRTGVCKNGKCVESKCGRPTIQPALEPGDRIFEGQVAVPHSWPWMAGLYDSDGHNFCGGVLISDQHVLTAAHCVCPDSATPLTVHLGSHKKETKDEKEVVYKAKHICVHPGYPCHLEKAAPGLNDIAIVTLGYRVKFSDAISPVCLPSHKEALPLGSTYHVTGWGRITSTTERIYSPELNQALVQEIPCSGYKYPTDSLICVRGVTGIHRRGDSGGPVVHRQNGTWTLFGLVRSGLTYFKTLGDASAVETRVSYFMDNFIKPYIKQNTSTDRMCGTFNIRGGQPKQN